MNSADCNQLRALCSPIHGGVCWRKRRNVSLAIFSHFKNLAPPDQVAAAAEAITGVPPLEILTSTEAAKKLKDVGVHSTQRSLQRLAERAAGTLDRSLVVYMNDLGKWDNFEKLVKNPIVKITVQMYDAARFLIEPLTQNS